MTAEELLEQYGPECGLTCKRGRSTFAGASTPDDVRAALAHSPFLMAPMAGVSDQAYRLMAQAGGAALGYSEMVSCAGIHYGGEKTWGLVDPDPAEPDLAVQLFGSDPELFAEAAEKVQARLGERLALIDVNMACPVPKVTKKGEGSALLDSPVLAAEIVQACVEHCDVPVTVKTRRARRPDGQGSAGDQVVDLAKAVEAAGASAIGVHGRYASQFYRGESDDGPVTKIAAELSIPVIATGDALTPERCVELLGTGAAGVFVARGTYGNPWIFSDALALLRGEPVPEHTAHERIAAFKLHVRLLEATGAHLARARSLAGWYLRGLPNAASWRERAMHCSSVDEYCALADAAGPPLSTDHRVTRPRSADPRPAGRQKCREVPRSALLAGQTTERGTAATEGRPHG
ncbi:tRNA dihydrouridine synthase [Kribbibacterium absianum]|uniref:tRNA dihydrouridine synthase n=1 Tax=Kribbibacterium absianum TaxID=3044210 RepID=UPI0024BD2A44|nr:tRNA-dihydrouridine synthase [Olsenella sp. YH-ols2216]